MVHEDVVNLLLERMEEMHRLLRAPHRNGAPEARVPGLLVLVITRADDHAAVPERRESGREAVHGLAQTAGLGERRDLAGHEDDLILFADGHCGLLAGGADAGGASGEGAAHRHRRGPLLRHLGALGHGRDGRRGRLRVRTRGTCGLRDWSGLCTGVARARDQRGLWLSGDHLQHALGRGGSRGRGRRGRSRGRGGGGRSGRGRRRCGGLGLGLGRRRCLGHLSLSARALRHH
mmetsp:Transcript_40422/g.113257  ORF Transcript_40422/g.113257 Transcript_40422/m.113257 type:complete len:233 (+) Transcript_40422:1507-2205(+)